MLCPDHRTPPVVFPSGVKVRMQMEVAQKLLLLLLHRSALPPKPLLPLFVQSQAK